MIQEPSTVGCTTCLTREVKLSFFVRYRTFLLSTNTLATIGNGILLLGGALASWIFNAALLADILFITATLVSGSPIFVLAARGILKRDLTAGVMVSVAMIGALLIGEYSAAALVAFMMMFGEMLENFTMARANNALKNLARTLRRRFESERTGCEKYRYAVGGECGGGARRVWRTRRVGHFHLHAAGHAGDDETRRRGVRRARVSRARSHQRRRQDRQGAGGAARLVRRLDTKGAVSRGRQENTGVGTRRATRLDFAGRDHLSGGRRHWRRRYVESVR